MARLQFTALLPPRDTGTRASDIVRAAGTGTALIPGTLLESKTNDELRAYGNAFTW